MAEQGRHTMRVVLQMDWVKLTPECHAPVGALCRLDCSVAGCETWLDPDHEHPLKHLDYCKAVVWIDEGLAQELAEGMDPFPLHDGMAINVAWDGKDWVWAPAVAS